MWKTVSFSALSFLNQVFTFSGTKRSFYFRVRVYMYVCIYVHTYVCIQAFLFRKNIKSEGANICRKHPHIQEGLHGEFNIYICFKTVVKNLGFILRVPLEVIGIRNMQHFGKHLLCFHDGGRQRPCLEVDSNVR